ncbi:hypothetical protein D4R87_02895 [bacterium]|nr:MAG: hypothetical protein D4R87_02895 [bacterium]
MYPILLCPLIIRENCTIFYTTKQEIEITMPQRLSEELVKLCDGTHSIAILIEFLSQYWEEKNLQDLFGVLESKHVLTDAMDLSYLIWNFIKNPTAWKPELNKQEISNLVIEESFQKVDSTSTYSEQIQPTKWTNNISNRCSSREFGKQNISKESLVRLLWSGQGAINSILATNENKKLYRKTIPSAGALFPITLHLCLFKDIANINKGIYRIFSAYPNKIDLGFLHNKLDSSKSCIVDTTIFENAIGMIIIVGCSSHSALKYGNRGILYTILEAGHAAQNILTCAQEEQIATVELGGFIEPKIVDLLGLAKNTQPLTVIVFGSRLNQQDKETKSTFDKEISEKDIIRKMEIVTSDVKKYHLSFYMVFAESITSSTGEIWWSCGRDIEKKKAIIKAKAEAVEWFVCSCIYDKYLVDGRFNKLKDNAVNPEDIVKYLPHQTQMIESFNSDKMYQWYETTEMFSEKATLALADLIFFPYFGKFGKNYAFSNSSGVAAHINVDFAIEHAVLENIEREAFMITWFNFLKRSPIEIQSLPVNIQDRIYAIEKAGFNINLVDITLDLTPVIMVVIVGKNNYPFFSCSTASGYDVIQIIDRALMEAESSVYCHLRDGNSRLILTASEITRTMDHGSFYENLDRIKKAEFLCGDITRKVTVEEIEENIIIHSSKELYQAIKNLELTILIANLTSVQELCKLPYKVVRVIIPGIVPMNFGYGIESLGLDRVRSVPVKCNLIEKLVPIKELNHFPHPFT